MVKAVGHPQKGPGRPMETASIILAAGRGSRMEGYDGNKTLLPLCPEKSPWAGTRPILVEIISNLPPGPKAVVVHYRKEDVIEATRHLGIAFCDQPRLDGTGGALLAARPFLESVECENVIITMGDVPLVRDETYRRLLEPLENRNLVVLGFRPQSRKQYGVLEIESGRVKRIIEWKYLKGLPEDRRDALRICNAGIYAARRKDILAYLPTLEARPHRVEKTVAGRPRQLKEFFITDLVEYMNEDGRDVGCLLAEDETEVMGVDDFSSLERARRTYRARRL